ncbi:MAG TPA: 6-pyruvoyl-tetrahydropterin synthase-related protein, partial [Patescibacteria group bacterium]
MIKPFFMSGFFPMHDDTQVARVFEMQKSLKDGMFPVRWTADLGYNYGYPIFNFYAPFAYYVGGFLGLTGLDSLSATKIMMAIGIVLSGLTMYLFAKQFWGIGGGIISALLYLYAPYHALDIYVRGDVAEFWAYAFIPIIFYGLWMAFHKQNWFYVIIGSLGYTAVIISHNLSAMMITPFIMLFILVLLFFSWKIKDSKKIYYPFLILLFGIILAAFYWLPVFSEMKYTNVLSQVGGGADYRDHFVCPVQLWSSPWGFGGSAPGCVDGLSFKLGKIHIGIFLLAVLSLFLWRKSEKEKFYLGVLISLFVLFSVFLTFSQSQFIWDAITPMAFLQYPWRFLLLAAFFMSFVGGAI